MTDKNKLKEIVLKAIDDNNIFLVDINVSKTNNITIYLDSYKGLTLKDCERIHKKIYPNIEQITGNFELNVSSPGLTNNFKVWQQYHKNIGHKIEILTLNNENMYGIIKEANENKFSIETKNQIITLPYDQVKKAKLVLKF